MTTLQRRNKSRWHNLKKRMGFVWHRRRWFKQITWTTVVVLGDRPVTIMTEKP